MGAPSGAETRTSPTPAAGDRPAAPTPQAPDHPPIEPVDDPEAEVIFFEMEAALDAAMRGAMSKLARLDDARRDRPATTGDSRPVAAPTEAEIRAALQAALDASRFDVGGFVYDITMPLHFIPPNEGAAPNPALWGDLRPSEAERLSVLVEEIYGLADGFERALGAAVVEAGVRAGLTFVAEHPDAPRATVPEEGAAA